MYELSITTLSPILQLRPIIEFEILEFSPISVRAPTITFSTSLADLYTYNMKLILLFNDNKIIITLK